MSLSINRAIILLNRLITVINISIDSYVHTLENFIVRFISLEKIKLVIMKSVILSDETIESFRKLKRSEESLEDVIARLAKEKQRQNEMKLEFQKFESVLEETEE
jgi:predicted CopG family antitoxin